MLGTGVPRFKFVMIEEIVGPRPSAWQENSELEIVKASRGVVIPFLKEIIEPRDFAFTERTLEAVIEAVSLEVDVDEKINPPSPKIDSTLFT